MKLPTSRLVFVVLVPAVACIDSATSIDAPGLRSAPTRVSTALMSSECGGQTDARDSRVQIELASLAELGSGSGLSSDGAGAYIGGTAGTQAKIFYHDAICSRSGDVVFDPDKDNYRPARKLIFYFPAGNSLGLSSAGVKSGASMTLAALMQLGSDVTWDPAMPVGRDAKIDAKYLGAARGLEFPAASALRPGYPVGGLATPLFRIQSTGIAGCEELEYETIRSTRTGGGAEFTQLVGQRSSYDNSPLGQWTTARNGSWTVQSVDSGTPAGHAAQCYTSKKGSVVKNGAPMNVPFRISVTELP